MPVRLRLVVDSDLPHFFEHQRQSAVVAMTSSPPRDEATFAARWARMRSDPSIVVRTIEVDGAVAGSIARFVRDGVPEVSYGLGEAFWGRGVATEALRQFLAEHPERPLRGLVLKRNPASLRVLQKCGFRIVGEDRFTSARGVEEEEWVLELP